MRYLFTALIVGLLCFVLGLTVEHQVEHQMTVEADCYEEVAECHQVLQDNIDLLLMCKDIINGGESA